jgi:DNA-3-methyladenine glycosylase
MHFCVNVICMPEGTAEGILLRAGRIVVGEELARDRRTRRRPGTAASGAIAARDLARGPARLCQALAIDRTQNGADLCDPASPLRLRRNDRRVGQDNRDDTSVSKDGQPEISVGPRVGVSAGADTNWRFWLTNDPTVSVYRPHKPRTMRPANHTGTSSAAAG